MSGHLVRVILAACAMTFLLPEPTRADDDLRATVMERRQVMRGMLQAYFPLLKISKGTKTDLAAAAGSAGDIANGMKAAFELFPAGTAKEEVPGSRAKPVVWSDAAGFQEAGEGTDCRGREPGRSGRCRECRSIQDPVRGDGGRLA